MPSRVTGTYTTGASCASTSVGSSAQVNWNSTSSCSLAALVLDRELGPDGDLEALTGDLDAERLVLLQGIGETPQLGHELRRGVDAFDVTSTLCHVLSMVVGPTVRLIPGG